MTTNDGKRHRDLQAVDIRIDDSGKLWVTLEDQKEYALLTDPSYQRSLDQRKVESIRSDWDPIAADPVTLSVRGNKVYIVNGQHEIAAALLEGEDCLLAEVFTGLNRAREADIRLKKNNARADTALEKFHARLTMEEAKPGQATAIVELLAEFGTFINKSQSRWSGINCVATIEKIYERTTAQTQAQGAILRRTLRALKETYGDLKGDAVTASLIEGVAWFVSVHDGELKWQKMVEVMRREGPAGLSDLARGFKRAMQGADWVNTYRALVEVYNKATRKPENKLELKTSRWTAELPGPGRQLKKAA